MAHFAQINEDNQVVQVIVINNSNIINSSGTEVEQQGVEFCKNLCGQDTHWIQTSYNSNFRKNFAGIGFTYDQQRDAFIPQKPFNSWILNEETCRWIAPVPHPTEGNYDWDESTISWKLIDVNTTTGNE